MKVAVIQMNCVTGKKEINFQIAGELIEKACEQGAKLIILPELFNTGYACNVLDWELAENEGEETDIFLRKYADEYSCSIIGGFVERAKISGLVYNSLMMVQTGKKTQVYRKNYLWGSEKNRFIKGTKLEIWQTEQNKIAPQICYEVGFSENAKIAALKGADILIYSSAFGKPRLHIWDIATKARAIETGCFVLASNHSDVEGDIAFCGHSRIVDPEGTVLSEAVEDNEMIIADIDLEHPYRQRDQLPYLRDLNIACIVDGYRSIEK